MSRQCEIIQDLLPLYVDDICSPSSKELVSTHISSCAECAGVLRKLKDTEIEEELRAEKTEVIRKHNKVFKRRSALIGLIIGIALMIPVIICFIVTLATGSNVRDLIIVLAAILLAASLIVVPLVVPRNKFLWALGLGTICLMLLLAVSITYDGGKWFFVAASSTLFGLALIFGPIVANHKSVKGHLGNHKALLVMGVDTILFILMMTMIGLATGSRSYWFYAMRISAVMLVLVWLIFVIIRYLKVNRFVKTGICCIIFGAFLFAVNNIISLLIGLQIAWPPFAPFTWNMFTIDGNVKWLCLITGTVLGLIFIIIGLFKGGKKK